MNTKNTLTYTILLVIFAFLGVHTPVHSMGNDEALQGEPDRTRRAINMINELVGIRVKGAKERNEAPVVDDMLKNALQVLHENDPHLIALTQRALRLFPSPLPLLEQFVHKAQVISREKHKNLSKQISLEEKDRMATTIAMYLFKRMMHENASLEDLTSTGPHFDRQLIEDLRHIHKDDPVRARILWHIVYRLDLEEIKLSLGVADGVPQMFAREEENAEQVDSLARNYRAFHDELHAYDKPLRPLKKVVVKEEIDNTDRVFAIGGIGLGLLGAFRVYNWCATVCSVVSGYTQYSSERAVCNVGYYGFTTCKWLTGAAIAAYALTVGVVSYQNWINSAFNLRALWNPKTAHKTIHADVNAQHNGSPLLHLSVPVIDSVEVEQVRDQSLADALKDQNIDYINSLGVTNTRTFNTTNAAFPVRHFDKNINKYSLARALIAHGADVQVKENGMTPLDYAVVKGDQKVAAMLICAGAPITDFARQHIQEYCAAFDQFGDRAFTEHLDAVNTTELEMARARLVGWKKFNMKRMLEKSGGAFFACSDRNEKRRHIEMLRKRTALVEQPSLEESVNAYVQTGFQPMLQKYCRLNRGVYKALNENTVLPQGPVDTTFSLLDGADRMKLMNKAHVFAAALGHMQLAQVLVACGAQAAEPEQTAYGAYADEFNAYNSGKSSTEKMQDFLMNCKNQVPSDA